MNIDYLSLQNFRGVQSMKIDFARQLNVFYGINGSGKSTVLDALAISLSWVTSRIKNIKVPRWKISDLDVCHTVGRTNANPPFIEVTGTHVKIPFFIHLEKRNNSCKEINKIDDLVYNIQEGLNGQKNFDLPLLVYYPVDRTVSKIDLQAKYKTFDQLETYNESLAGSCHFESFFLWYRDREDYENERLLRTKDRHRDPQLQAIRKVISSFMGDFSEPRVCRGKGDLRMEIKKKDFTLRIDQLSMGEKCLLTMVGDIARRLAIANPSRSDPLQGEGIVLIDEVDLHLHPAWQRTVISKLLETFPNIQFFISTHSPQVIGEVYADSNNQRVFELFEKSAQEGVKYNIPNQTFGLDSNNVLGIMKSITQDEEVQKEIHEISKLIDKENFSKAKVEIVKLEKKLNGSIPQTLEASTLISMLSTK